MKNDNKIMELQKQIDAKKEQLKEIQIFKPITNCMITYYHGAKLNINAMSINDLKILAIRLHNDLKSQTELGFSDTLLNGFALEDWKTDILAKIKNLEQKDKLNQLAQAELELQNLLSNDKKTELAIDKISEILA